MQRIGRDRIEALRDTLPENASSAEDRYRNYTTITTMRSPTEGDYSRHSWCAHFVEVRVDEAFGTVRVSRVVSAMDSGRVYNPKLAESQWKGGIIMGIGQALLEEGIVDPAPWPGPQQQSGRLSDRDQFGHSGPSGDLGRHPGL